MQEGFWYHHAEPKYLMLVHWIADSANTIPANATHRVGVGALVVNDKREVFTLRILQISEQAAVLMSHVLVIELSYIGPSGSRKNWTF